MTRLGRERSRARHVRTPSRADDARPPKVRDFPPHGRPRAREQQIAGVDVLVDDAGGVRRRQAPQQVVRRAQRKARPVAAARHVLAERAGVVRDEELQQIAVHFSVGGDAVARAREKTMGWRGCRRGSRRRSPRTSALDRRRRCSGDSRTRGPKRLSRKWRKKSTCWKIMSTATIARKRLLTVCGSAYHLAPSVGGMRPNEDQGSHSMNRSSWPCSPGGWYSPGMCADASATVATSALVLGMLDVVVSCAKRALMGEEVRNF